jgi:hypothetical protein
MIYEFDTLVMWAKTDTPDGLPVQSERGKEDFFSKRIVIDLSRVEALEESVEVKSWSVVLMQSGTRYLIPVAYDKLREELRNARKQAEKEYLLTKSY